MKMRSMVRIFLIILSMFINQTLSSQILLNNSLGVDRPLNEPNHLFYFFTLSLYFLDYSLFSFIWFQMDVVSIFFFLNYLVLFYLCPKKLL